MANKKKAPAKAAAPKKEELTPEVRYRNFLTQLLNVNQQMQGMRQQYGQLKDNATALEGALQALEQALGFNREEVAKELLDEQKSSKKK